MSDAASGFGENVCDVTLGKAKEVSTRHGRSDSTLGTKARGCRGVLMQAGPGGGLGCPRGGGGGRIWFSMCSSAWLEFFFFEFKNESYI